MNTVYAVGIGPGHPDQMTILAYHTLEKSDVIVGYHVYTELVKESFPDKTYLTTPMTGEVKRCRMALEQAQTGKTVSVICSGDAGVYGMASLLYELLQEYPDVEVKVVPGVTAALSGGALLGAPLAHDFAVISLSDRLTEPEKIRKRLQAAAQADLAICIYNPASHGRPDYLQKACGILLEILPPDRVCGVARKIGREGEEMQILSLAELQNYPADMFTTVFIGNSETKEICGRMVTPRGYRRKENE